MDSTGTSDAEMTDLKWKDEILNKIDNRDATYSAEVRNRKKNIDVQVERCIYKVPDKLQKLNKDAYHPRLVSIGPFHRGKTNLALMDKIKLDYMTSFLDRFSNGSDSSEVDDRRRLGQCLQKCIDTIYGSKEQVLKMAVPICYGEEIEYNEQLAEIMLFDGCFILELFLRYDSKGNEFDNDPLLRSCWRMEALRHDLVLLENQIPFFILQLLYGELIKSFVKRFCDSEPPKSVACLALKFFQPAIGQEGKKEESTAKDLQHLLDLLHKSYFPQTVQPTPGNNQPAPAVLKEFPCPCWNISITSKTQSPESQIKKWGFKYCASELLASGVDFQVASDQEHNLMDITFNEGVITIPQLCITDTTSSLFRNLIAYEQCNISSKPMVTSYAFFMNSLVNSPRDSKLLQDKNIIKFNREDRHFSTEFKRIIDEVVVKDDFYFGPLFDQVNVYRKSWCHLRRILVFIREQSKKQKHILCKTYCSSTWKVISLIAAVFLLLLTSLQTYFTIYPRS